jgi:sigma-B regulation protein RsbU (phosphoserine phosphatase)
LPEKCPDVEGFEIAATNISSQQVGGDYYDCIQLDEKHVCVTIADVSGKGIPASLLMANVQASLHALIDSDQSLSFVTSKINNIIHRNTGHDKFITFFAGIIDIENYTFTSVNAGHNPPYLYRANDSSLKLLEKGGLILGMMANMSYEQEMNQLHSGDWIIMFTDGISEAMNENEEEFEEHRIETVIKQNIEVSAEKMKDNILAAVKEFTAGTPQSDDITMIIVKVTNK